MGRIKQTNKGWVSVTKLPSNRYMTAAFLKERVNPIQQTSSTKANAMKKARSMSNKYL